MYFDERDNLVREEQLKDRQRRQEQQQLSHPDSRQSQNSKKLLQSAAVKLGEQMVKWGSKLQHDPASSPPRLFREPKS